MSTPLVPAAIAADLTEGARAALLALSEEQWSRVPDLWATTELLTNHGIPLIVVTGDWVKPSRIGLAVKRELQSFERTGS